MSAEYLTNKYIEDNTTKNITVSSAGTSANPESPFPATIERLAFYGCHVSHHQQRKISKEILKDQTIIICMAEHHRQTIRELWFDAVLFNEIAYNTRKNVLDDTEYMNQYWPDLDLNEYVPKIVDYIYKAIPFVIKNIMPLFLIMLFFTQNWYYK